MVNTERILYRIRTTLDEWFVLVVVLLVALALFGGWMTFGTVMADESQTEDSTVEAWSTTGGFDYVAEVQTTNEVYDVGEELRHQSVYFTEIAPEVTAEFEHRYEADEGDVDVEITIERVVRATDGDGDEYWSTAEVIEETAAEGVGPRERQTVPFTVDVPTFENDSERIAASLGGTPGTVESLVVAHVQLNGSIDGESIQRSETFEFVVEPAGTTYEIDAASGERHTEERTVTETVPSDSGFDDALPGLALLIGAMGGIGVLVMTRHRGTLAPSKAVLERVRHEHERARNDEWISRGVLPPELYDRPRVHVDSLADLVDVAIDCGQRVIEDRSGDESTYVVVDPEVLYVHEAVSSPEYESIDAALFDPDEVADQELAASQIESGMEGDTGTESEMFAVDAEDGSEATAETAESARDVDIGTADDE